MRTEEQSDLGLGYSALWMSKLAVNVHYPISQLKAFQMTRDGSFELGSPRWRGAMRSIALQTDLTIADDIFFRIAEAR